MDDLITDFIAETREGLEMLDSELVRFEQNPDDPELLGGIFRLIHTIKGTCGFLGLMRLQTVAHAAENVLGAFRDGELAVTPAAVSAILDTVDLIRTLVDALASDGGEPPGDDAPLVARLEAVLGGSAGEAPPRASAPDTRPLIEQLGGDATLDAACEMRVGLFRTGALAQIDPDRLQATVRDGLIAAARGQGGGRPLAAALEALAPGGSEPLCLMLRAVGEALTELEVPRESIVTLIDRLQPPAAVAGLAKADGVSATDTEASASPQTIRVSVDALEHLMTVVSELVLIRNQLIQTLRLEPESPFAAPLNRLNQVTSELQEGVMTTRMQPISGAWAKLPRLVRDLAQDLGKKIDLVLVGQETELDRQVLELIKDPLTHMIRNAADHGLEGPDERRAAGKPEAGRITLAARHEGGAIVIEVSDDGRGLSAAKIRTKAVGSGLVPAAQAEAMSDAEVRQFIFAAGFSTAGEITAVSGRGVGMDVVRTNIEKIGGAIELASVEGEGTRFTIRIPLTLTIVSALIVECCGERFAMPQSSVVELVSASDASGRQIEYIDGSAVLRLRDRLLPLVSLQSLLGLEPQLAVKGETCIVVARVGAFSFGVIVDRVFDTEEIVVKPVATVLRHLKLYSGATILGDGSVILILDFKGMSLEAGAGQIANSEEPKVSTAAAEDTAAVLVFRGANNSLKAAPLAAVARIEEVSPIQLERVDGRTVIQYRGRLMPIVSSDAGDPKGWAGEERRPLLVFTRDERSIGLLVNEIVDVVESTLSTELEASGAGALGSLIINDAAAELIDVAHYWRQGVGEPQPTYPAPPGPAAKRLLIIDQSPFCQLLLGPLLGRAGYEVTVARDAAAALALHGAGKAFHLILIDSGRKDEEARALAGALSAAVNWHRTPLLGLGLQTLAGQDLQAETLLDAVSGSMRGAA